MDFSRECSTADPLGVAWDESPNPAVPRSSWRKELARFGWLPSVAGGVGGSRLSESTEV